MPSVAVILATYGDKKVWDRFAYRAQMSVEAQTKHANEFHRIHADHLHVARNRGAMAASSDWLIFLDADDELEPRYIESMALAVSARPEIDLHVPFIWKISNGKIVQSGKLKDPAASIFDRNHLPIGAMVRRDLFLETGGFDDWPIYEDWALWMKVEAAGARWAWCPDAIYKIHWREGSRNKHVSLRAPTLQAIRDSLLESPVRR